MRSTSLTRRAITTVLVAEFLCALVFSLSALEHEHRTRLRAFDVMLQGRSDSILGAIQDAEDPGDHVLVDSAEVHVPEQDLFAVYDLGGALVGQSKDAPFALIQRQASGFSERSVHKRRYRVLERSAMRLVDRSDNTGSVKRPVTIVYAAPLDHVSHEIIEAAGFYCSVSLVLLLLTALLLVLLLRRVLEPIQELALEASAVSVLAPRFKAPESALRVRELQPLAQTLTVAIDGLRQTIETQHRFVGDAAHELKTAVAVVRSTIQVLMMRTRTREEYAHGLEVLLNDNRRVEELVARMLLLARMEEKGSDDSAITSLKAALERIVSRLHSFAEAQNIRLVLTTSAETNAAITPEKIDVLISNLVVNAVQHSPPGSQIEVDTSIEANTITIKVRDSGSGISASALPHVFERFYREDTSRSRETGGSGLGLAICKSIVESVGGTIAVESVAGTGTSVRVTLNRA